MQSLLHYENGIEEQVVLRQPTCHRNPALIYGTALLSAFKHFRTKGRKDGKKTTVLFSHGLLKNKIIFAFFKIIF
jgi:hypothetical protein